MDILEHGELVLKSDNPNDIIKEIYKVFSHKLHVGFDYRNRTITEFKRNSISLNNKENTKFMFKVMYVNVLAHYATFKDDGLLGELVNEDIAKEFLTYNDEGALCMFSSVLLYELLLADKELKSFNAKTLKYIQGYYKHQTREGTFVRMMSPQLVGIHAFLTFNNAVIDTTIQQIEDEYDNAYMYFIAGEEGGKVASDIAQWYGVTEKTTTIDKYTQDYVQRFGYKNKKQWIKKHEDSIIKVLTQLDESIKGMQ